MKKKLHIGQRGQQKCGNGAAYLKKFLVVDKNLAKPTISWFFSKVLTFWVFLGHEKIAYDKEDVYFKHTPRAAHV